MIVDVDILYVERNLVSSSSLFFIPFLWFYHPLLLHFLLTDEAGRTVVQVMVYLFYCSVLLVDFSVRLYSVNQPVARTTSPWEMHQVILTKVAAVSSAQQGSSLKQQSKYSNHFTQIQHAAVAIVLLLQTSTTRSQSVKQNKEYLYKRLYPNKLTSALTVNDRQRVIEPSSPITWLKILQSLADQRIDTINKVYV